MGQAEIVAAADETPAPLVRDRARRAHLRERHHRVCVATQHMQCHRAAAALTALAAAAALAALAAAAAAAIASVPHAHRAVVGGAAE
eukprot:scaffold114403_cov33-Phaeocystis_antarctica.AAC.1